MLVGRAVSQESSLINTGDGNLKLYSYDKDCAKIFRLEAAMFKPKGPYCQSCGMPLSKDEKGGGTEADGRKSSQYCSHCYAAGQFTDPNLTVEQMVEKVRGKMKEMYIP